MLLYSNASSSNENARVIGINHIKLKLHKEHFHRKQDIALENTMRSNYVPIKKKVTFADTDMSISANCYKQSSSSSSDSESESQNFNIFFQGN